MSSVLASHRSHRDRPCENTGAVLDKQPIGAGWHNAQKRTADKRHDTLPYKHRVTHAEPRKTKSTTQGKNLMILLLVGVQVPQFEWETFPEKKTEQNNLIRDKAQDYFSQSVEDSPLNAS